MSCKAYIKNSWTLQTPPAGARTASWEQPGKPYNNNRHLAGSGCDFTLSFLFFTWTTCAVLFSLYIYMDMGVKPSLIVNLMQFTPQSIYFNIQPRKADIFIDLLLNLVIFIAYYISLKSKHLDMYILPVNICQTNLGQQKGNVPSKGIQCYS